MASGNFQLMYDDMENLANTAKQQAQVLQDSLQQYVQYVNSTAPDWIGQSRQRHDDDTRTASQFIGSVGGSATNFGTQAVRFVEDTQAADRQAATFGAR